MTQTAKDVIIHGKRRGFPSGAPEDMVLMEEYTTMTAKEIAAKYHVAESTVRNWLQAARKRLRAVNQQA